MTDDTRRAFLGSLAAIATVGVAGCSGDDTGGDADTPAPTESMDGMTETEDGMGDMTETEDRMGDMTETEDGMTDASVTFAVRVENVGPTDFYGADTATGGQVWVTPGAYATYDGENPVFTEGEPASIGLEALAEAGPPTGFAGEPGLVDELAEHDAVASAGAYAPSATVADPNDPMGEVPGAPPIAPGGAFEFEVDADPGQRLSIASMYVPSNDVFVSPETGIDLYDDGDPVSGSVTGDLRLWDAGTEVNGRPGVAPNGAPRQAQNGGPAAGPTEGVVHRLENVDDAFEYPDPSDVLTVTVDPQ